MTAQVLFFDASSEKDPHLNAVEIADRDVAFNSIKSMMFFRWDKHNINSNCYKLPKIFEPIQIENIFGKTSGKTKISNKN